VCFTTSWWGNFKRWLLDYAMGWGHLASVARAFNYRAHGFELSERRRAYAQDREVDVVADLQAGAYGFINAHHVLEHVPDPLATLTSIVGATEPGGRRTISSGRVSSRPRGESVGFEVAGRCDLDLRSCVRWAENTSWGVWAAHIASVCARPNN
jgi:hypothetical protein